MVHEGRTQVCKLRVRFIPVKKKKKKIVRWGQNKSRQAQHRHGNKESDDKIR